ncbi:hypothetical protein Cni_G21160 [Canna indica]|uniref:Uncharacterized protein n=1 Tax=Canna indica TaxID=4628 RepID=A0AAQ3KNZ2_9LILI|nr:hypothetical protein Cni_G21160 [Canna indica]
MAAERVRKERRTTTTVQYEARFLVAPIGGGDGDERRATAERFRVSTGFSERYMRGGDRIAFCKWGLNFVSCVWIHLVQGSSKSSLSSSPTGLADRQI